MRHINPKATQPEKTANEKSEMRPSEIIMIIADATIPRTGCLRLGMEMVLGIAEFAIRRRYLHAKFAATLVSPVPLYRATCGYGQSGRVLSTTPLVLCDA